MEVQICSPAASSTPPPPSPAAGSCPLSLLSSPIQINLLQDRDTQGLISVTMKQSSEAFQSGYEKSNFIIDGVDVTNVKVVGMLINKNVRSSDIRFHLDDGTGRAECIRWVTENLDVREMDAIEDGAYVRAIGHSQSSTPLEAGMTARTRPVTNLDEVTCHFFKCIHLHLQNSKVQKGTVFVVVSLVVTGWCFAPDADGRFIVEHPANVYQPALKNDFSLQNITDGITNFGPELSAATYKHCPRNGGTCRRTFTTVESSRMEDQVSFMNLFLVNFFHLLLLLFIFLLFCAGDAIEFLEKEGLVYSCIDDYHYKAVEGC